MDTSAMLRTWPVKLLAMKFTLSVRSFQFRQRRNLGLTAKFSFCADFAGHAGYFAGEGVKLVEHGVNGVFQFENLAFDVDRDFARQVAASYGSGDFGNVSDLTVRFPAMEFTESVRSFQVPARRERWPGLRAAFAADFAGDACDFSGETVELVDHCVQRFFELQDFAAHVDGNFAGQIAIGNGGRDFSNVSHLAVKLLA